MKKRRTLSRRQVAAGSWLITSIRGGTLVTIWWARLAEDLSAAFRWIHAIMDSAMSHRPSWPIITIYNVSNDRFLSCWSLSLSITKCKSTTFHILLCWIASLVFCVEGLLGILQLVQSLEFYKRRTRVAKQFWGVWRILKEFLDVVGDRGFTSFVHLKLGVLHLQPRVRRGFKSSCKYISTFDIIIIIPAVWSWSGAFDQRVAKR